MSTVDQIIGAESGGDPSAKNPNSSASGAGQFIDSTWLDILKSARPDLVAGKSDADLLALKTDPDLSRQMTAAYATQNQGILNKAGVPVTPGTTYLAHFAGPTGAIGILNADPSTPAGAVLGDSVVRSNPFLAHMTAGDVANWANRKMGLPGAPLSIAGPSQPAPSAPQAPAPQQAAPQQAAPAAVRASPMLDIAALANVPRGPNLLPQRPNPLGVRLAPLSLGG